jgi:hypothetical protein
MQSLNESPKIKIENNIDENSCKEDEDIKI